jgi:hypothetical protein
MPAYTQGQYIFCVDLIFKPPLGRVILVTWDHQSAPKLWTCVCGVYFSLN